MKVCTKLRPKCASELLQKDEVPESLRSRVGFPDLAVKSPCLHVIDVEPGKVAVVAEAWEEWVTPVDTRIEELGGIVLRRVRGEVIDAQIERDVKTLRTELASLRDEQSRALKDQRAKLDAKIERAKSELHAAQDRAKAALDAATHEGEAKIRLLEERLGRARGDAKTKIDARIKATRAEYQRRSELLRQAWDLARQAVAG